MEEVRALFDKASGDYDRARRQLVPCFDDLYGMVLDLIPYRTNAEIKVLDLGAGTGLLSALIAQAYPRAQITLVDLSAKMLDVAQRRFVDEPDRFEFIVADYNEELPPKRYDLVVSALSIHHLKNPYKEKLFRKVYDVLGRGGAFINADQALGPTPEVENFYWEAWLRQVRAKGVNEDDLLSAMTRMKEDKSSTLESQLGWMEESGFEMVDCWYKYYGFTVYSGRKPR